MSMEKWKKQNANDTGKMFEFRNWGINEKGIHNKQQEEKMEKCIYYKSYIIIIIKIKEKNAVNYDRQKKS